MGKYKEINPEELIIKLKEILEYLKKINALSVTGKLSHDFIKSFQR
jgi:hypothetical protein